MDERPPKKPTGPNKPETAKKEPAGVVGRGKQTLPRFGKGPGGPAPETTPKLIQDGSVFTALGPGKITIRGQTFFLGEGESFTVDAPDTSTKITATVEAQAAPASASASGNVNIAAGTDHLTITGFPATVAVTKSLVMIWRVAPEHTASLQRLKELQNELAAVHGVDAPEVQGNRNTQEIPLTEDALATARAVVDAAIDLHQAPAVSRPIIDALEGIRQHIEKLGEVVEELGNTIDKSTRTVEKLKGLALAMAAAASTLALLIEKITSLLSG